MTEQHRKLLGRLFVTVVMATMVALAWTHRDWFEPAAIQSRLADHDWAPLAFLLVHTAIGLSFLIPRTVMGIAAGLLFGLYWGVVLTVLGTMLGAWSAFGLARLYCQGRDTDLSRLPGMSRIKPWLVRLDHSGWRGVWALRLLPLPHSPLNYALGLTSIGWGSYSVGTLLGTFPLTVVTVAVGAAGGGALSGSLRGWLIPTACGVGGLVLSVIASKWGGRR